MFNYWQNLILFSLLILVTLLSQVLPVRAQDEAPQPQDAANQVNPVQRLGARIRVPLPITGAVDTEIQKSLKKLLSKFPEGEPRPVVVLEFSSKRGASGKGSQFERCLSLATFLTSNEMSRVRTVAYIPKNIQGHAVLAALACEQISMHADAEIGNAGVEEKNVTEIMRQAYLDTAGKRNALPQAIALGMLDPEEQVYRVNNQKYVNNEEYQKLKQDGEVAKSEKIVPTGEMALFTGSDLRLKYQLIGNLSENLDQLAQTMGIAAGDLLLDYAMDKDWKAVRIAIDSQLTMRLSQQSIQLISNALSQGKNFIILDIDSPGGDPIACQNLLNYLADLPDSVRTVALIQKQAQANAALIGFVCDEIAVAHDAQLGGEGAYSYSEQGNEDLQNLLKILAPKVNRSWSAWAAMCDPQMSVYQYQQPATGIVGYFSEDEQQSLVRPQDWKQGEEITKPAEPLMLSGQLMLEYGLADVAASSLEDITLRYDLPTKVETPKVTWANELIAALARPGVAYMLLFIGVWALMGEMQAPGVGIPGFVAVICFGLFFWSQFLNGTAGWLEVMLFIGGVTFVLVELFVLPGFGIFGLGGALMIVASIVLAMQTFIMPSTDYELEQLPYSLFNIFVILFAVVVGLFSARHILPHLPFLGDAYLGTPDEDLKDELARREVIVDLSHLVGKVGTTTTPLRPSGKARFGNEVVNVSSDGELIDNGKSVEVIENHGNYVTVRCVG